MILNMKCLFDFLWVVENERKCFTILVRKWFTVPMDTKRVVRLSPTVQTVALKFSQGFYPRQSIFGRTVTSAPGKTSFPGVIPLAQAKVATSSRRVPTL
jgi:hypothetical protein